MNYRWKLNDNQFTFLDRLKICAFFLNPRNFWTQNVKVQGFERKMADYVGCKYSVFVSSGSTANTILAAQLRDTASNKNIVVFPSTTWTTSCSPFIREGFKPEFIDISLSNLSLDLDKLESYLSENSQNVACIFITCLLGFCLDIPRLKKIELKYNVKIMLDNCEGNLTSCPWENISKHFTSTTSTYCGHCVNSVEGGFLFTSSENEYQYFLMARNHGMTRSLDNYYADLNIDNPYVNPNVDKRFDFNLLGNNFRNTDINAFIGLLDFKRIKEYKLRRIELYYLFRKNLDLDKYILPVQYDYRDRQSVAFSLPIIAKNKDKNRFNSAKLICDDLKIESRPVISGFLGFQTAFSKYFSGDLEEKYKNSIYIHKFGFYCGLHAGVKEKAILELTKKLNKI